MVDELRVFGPPGTGKTTWLTGQVERAAERHGPGRVMVTSFTRAAALEVASRDTGLPRENIGTLHSFAYHLAGRPGIAELPKWAVEWSREHPHWRLSAAALMQDGEPAPSDFGSTDGDGLLQEYNRLRAELREPPAGGRLKPFVDAWQRFKADAGLMDFTDLLIWLQRHHPQPPRAARVLFVDEAQDLTPLQFAIVRQWAPHLDTLVLAGDDDQILYEFLGASPEAFLLPPVPDESKRVLAQSYRVPEAVQRTAKRWIERVAFREPKTYRPRDEEGEAQGIDASIADPVMAVRDARQRIDAGQSVMFLASCGFMLNRLAQQLRLSAVPFWNPYRPTHGGWNPLRLGAKGPAQRVAHFLAPQTGEGAWWTASEFEDWTSVLRAKDALVRGAKAQLAKMARAEPGRVLALDEWQGYLDPTVWAHAESGDLDWYQRSILGTKGQSYSYPVAVAKRHGAGALTTEPRVILGTIHSVKGGEADAVYLFPDISIQAVADWSGGDRDALRRLFYVGMTRARQSLLLPEPASENTVSELGG